MVVQAGKCWCISACPTVLWCWSSGRRPYQAMKKRFENLRKTFLKTTWKKNIEKTNPYFQQKLHHATWQRNRRVWCLLSFTGRVWPPQPQLKNGCKVRSSMKGGKRGKSFNKRNRWSNFFLRSKRWEWLIPLCWLVLRNEIQYIYIYRYTHIKSRVAVHQRFRGSKEFQLSGWFTQGFSGHSTCFFGSYLSSACARLRVGHCH